MNKVKTEQGHRSPEPPDVTIITIGLDQEICDTLLQLADQAKWKVWSRSLSNHISSRRRPHLPVSLINVRSVIAFVDFDGSPAEAIESISYLRQMLGARLFAVSLSADFGKVLESIRAGCCEFLTKPLQVIECNAALRRLEERVAAASVVPHVDGAVLAFLGAKGGVGTTTLAVHLAAFLAQECKKKVLLIDNQNQFGHVCIYLGIDGALFHFQEVVTNIYRLDSEMLRGFVAKHATGVDVLSSPDIGEAARVMHPDDVRETLEYLRTQYDFVLVDCAGRLDEISRAVIDSAAQVYVVATPEISALRDLSRYVDELTKQDDQPKIKVVVNRFSSQFAVSLAEIEMAIRMPVAFNVPNSFIELVRSANLGTPLAASLNNGFTTELSRWAWSLMGDIESKPVRHESNSSRRSVEVLGTVWAGIVKTCARLTSGIGALNG